MATASAMSSQYAELGLYVTVRCPSVCPACGWFAAKRGRMQQISIDSRYAAPALSSRCGQRHVESRGTRLSTQTRFGRAVFIGTCSRAAVRCVITRSTLRSRLLDCRRLSALLRLRSIGWLGSLVVSVLDSGAEGPGSNRSRDAVG